MDHRTHLSRHYSWSAAYLRRQSLDAKRIHGHLSEPHCKRRARGEPVRLELAAVHVPLAAVKVSFQWQVDFELSGFISIFARIDTKTMVIKQKYCKPQAESFSTWSHGMICESPEAGGLEDIEYDDWVIS